MHKYFLIVSFLLSQLWAYSQDCCIEANKVTLCYTAEDDFCIFPSCRYTYDSNNMLGISQKIANKDNFGPNGTSCDIEVKALKNITDVESIENLGCKIVFIGHFAPDNNAGFGTTIPNAFLNTVREWSLKCTENLVILFQDEAELWGYQIDDDNNNPNIQGTSTENNIFDGPFGSLSSFDQGGTFQANFSQLAPTGSDVLAVDGRGRPTIVLDRASNDLVLADVGILCNGPGDISVSPLLENNNDILACNIIAVGCDISTSSFTEQAVELCENATYELPDGMTVNEAGEYFTTLKSKNNCDSIISTQISIALNDTTSYRHVGCEQDSFSIELGSELFDINNRRGLAKLVSEMGCDSFVAVELILNSSTSGTFDTSFCSRQPFVYEGLEFGTSIDTTLIIENSLGCDSVISFSAREILFEESNIETSITASNGLTYQMNNSIPDEFDIVWSNKPGLSCLDCPNPTVELYENIDAFNLTLTSPNGCIETYDIAVNYSCQPYIPNIFDRQSSGENKLFGPMVPCEIEDYQFRIYDRWGGLIFESNDQAEKWSGYQGSQQYASGIYVYRLDYSINNEALERTGMVHVVR